MKINGTISKKIIVSFLLVIMMLQVVMPYISCAAIDSAVAEKEGGIQTVVKFISNGDNIITNYTEGEAEASINSVKTSLKTQLETIYGSTFADSEFENIYKYFYNTDTEGSKVKVKFELINTSWSGGSFNYPKVTVTIDSSVNKDAIDTAISEGANYPDIVDELTGSFSSTAGTGNAAGAEDGIDSDDFADIGGILLSPVFYLVNFVADAILSCVENIMNGETIALVGDDSGFTILQGTAIPATGDINCEVDVSKNWLGNIQYPNITYTPEEIFSGKIDLLSIDFISGKTVKTDENGEIVTEIDENGKEVIVYENNQNADWKSIRKVISEWYKALRMIAIVGLLSVLIYTGIKIMISANAKDKAKYKEWIINWFVAVAILFFMHYIMSFIISVIGEVNQIISQGMKDINVKLSTGKTFSTNLMGLVRFMIQIDDFYVKIGYEVMYIALIVYTIKFTLIYLKRVLNMAFLTLIAPIVALTYPIDKMNDGSAKGFDMWLKEYIFNALLQPMHLILYYVLVGSSVSIAAANPIYGIVVLMFMTEAEKLLKKIFGFDKAGGGTVGGMTGAFAAGAIASKIGNIARMSKLPGGNAGKGGSGSSGSSNAMLNNPKATEKDAEKDDALFLNGNDGNDGGDSGGGSEGAGGNDSTRESNQSALDGLKGEAKDDEDAAILKSWEDEYAGDAGAPQQGQASTEESAQEEPQQGQQEDAYPGAAPIRALAASVANTRAGQAMKTGAQKVADSKLGKGVKSAVQSDKAKKLAKGSKAVGKRMLKPIWDTEQGLKYNAGRWGRRIGRAYVGASLGIAAAAVQAGISITDGKYNPLEGVATFTAGYAGGGRISSGIGSLRQTYIEGAIEGDNKAIMKRAQDKWPEREDVIKHNKKYKPEERKAIVDIQKQLLAQGVSSPKEMDSCIKYMKKLNGGSLEGISENADMIRKARVMHDFVSDSYASKGIHDADKREKYIESVAKDDREKTILRNKYKEALTYLDAQQ